LCCICGRTKSKRSSRRQSQHGGKSRPVATSTAANIRSVSGGEAVAAAGGGRKADTAGLLRDGDGGGKRGRRRGGSSPVGNHVIHVDMTVDGDDDDDDANDGVGALTGRRNNSVNQRHTITPVKTRRRDVNVSTQDWFRFINISGQCLEGLVSSSR